MSPIEDLFEEFWTWRLERSPEFSTLAGSKLVNSQLEIFTETRFLEDKNSCQVFLERAETLLSSSTDPDESLNLRFFIAELQTFIAGYPFKGFYFPMSYMEGVQVDFQKLIEWVSLDTVTDYQDLISRYEKFSVLAEQIMTMMRAGISSGLTSHAVSINGVEAQCRGHLGDPRETVFFQPFTNITSLPVEEAIKLQDAALAAIETSVQAGFAQLADFIADEYSPATRPDIAASSLPGVGPEYYKACLAFHTSTNLTAEEIHQKGLEEVERIEEEMKKIIQEMGYTLSLQEFVEMLRNDKNNFFNSAEELLAGFRDIIENRIEGKLLDIFHDKPQTKLEVTEVPASTPDAPAAYYISGTADGKRPGRLFVNTHKYASQPRYEMVSLTLHETLPGHHLQGSYMLEKEDWPMFRQVTEGRIYTVPSSFPLNTAYTEGWGLYSESLGFDMELYSDPLDRFGHLSEEIFRACRLVVDTGMHAFGWSSERAVQFMMDHTAASPESIRGEVDRYVTWPGQATAYKIGQMKIRELRRKAEMALGEEFNIKDFHQVVLDAVGPLNILEEQIDAFIASELKTSTGN